MAIPITDMPRWYQACVLAPAYYTTKQAGPLTMTIYLGSGGYIRTETAITGRMPIAGTLFRNGAPETHPDRVEPEPAGYYRTNRGRMVRCTEIEYNEAMSGNRLDDLMDSGESKE